MAKPTVSGQTIYDLLIQHHGGISSLFEVLRKNPDMSAEEHFGGTRELEIEDRDNSVTSFVRRENLTIVTGEHNEANYPGGAYGSDYSIDYD